MNASQRIQRKGAKAQRRKEAVYCCLSLAPGFSPVLVRETSQSRFNGLADLRRVRRMAKTVETVFILQRPYTRLKPGANEIFPFCVSAPLRLCVKK